MFIELSIHQKILQKSIPVSTEIWRQLDLSHVDQIEFVLYFYFINPRGEIYMPQQHINTIKIK